MGPSLTSAWALLGELTNPAVGKQLWASVRRGRQDPHPPERADALADIVLRDHESREVRLGDEWRDRPAALVFLRHWG